MGKPCPDCGGHRWAAAGHCLEIQCAGYYWEEDYPKSAKKHEDNLVESIKEEKKKEARPPRTEKGRREAELYYEGLGKKAPWVQ